MKTDASPGQSTHPTSGAATDESISPGAVEAAPDNVENGSEGSADLLAVTSPETAPAVAPLPAGRTSTTQRTRITWLSNLTQGLSLDERLGRIVLSAVLAFLLWFYVTSLENPAQTTQFNGLPVEVRGLDSNLKVINTVPTVNVTVQAPQNVMNNLREADVRPYVDLHLLGAGVHEVPVATDVTGLADHNSINFSVAPRTIQVQLEAQATRVFSVSVNVSGTPAFGYGAEAAQVDPAQVQVTGSENAISRIAQVVVSVDIQDRAGTQRGYKNPVALDSSGQEITGLTFEPTTVQVVVPIKLLLNYKLVPVHVPVIGNPAPGYSAYEIKLDPTNITICCAPSNILEPILSLDTQPVSISGTTTTVMTTTQLILPAGVELYPGQTHEISVTVRIDTFETTWQLSVAPTIDGLAAGTTAVLSPSSLDLTLSGTLAQFQNLKPSDVRASINVAGLGTGTFELEPEVTVPPGVKLVSITPPKISVSLIPPTPVPPTPTQVPTAVPTATANALAAPSHTPFPSPTHTRVLATESPTSSPNATPTPTPSPVHNQTPTPTPTGTP
jgi:YbbR domain-containing protein